MEKKQKMAILISGWCCSICIWSVYTLVNAATHNWIITHYYNRFGEGMFELIITIVMFIISFVCLYYQINTENKPKQNIRRKWLEPYQHY